MGLFLSTSQTTHASLPQPMSLVKIDEGNLNIYKNLTQAYEAEFSPLTHKEPNTEGVFEPDTLPFYPYTGYLLYHKTIPAGFCVVNVEGEINDVAEFYIIPTMRKRNYGRLLAEYIFDKHPGQWQVRQIEGAEHAIKFWRKVISKYTNNSFLEEVVEDEDWGIVTRQTFMAAPKMKVSNPESLL